MRRRSITVVYTELDTLVDKGLVKKGEQDRQTNVYSMTYRGSREIDARRKWENQYVDRGSEQAATSE